MAVVSNARDRISYNNRSGQSLPEGYLKCNLEAAVLADVFAGFSWHSNDIYLARNGASCNIVMTSAEA